MITFAVTVLTERQNQRQMTVGTNNHITLPALSELLNRKKANEPKLVKKTRRGHKGKVRIPE